MTAIVATITILLMAIAIIRWVASVPLVRALTASIDNWADAVHGREAEPLS
jgi:hypothetical protein